MRLPRHSRWLVAALLGIALWACWPACRRWQQHRAVREALVFQARSNYTAASLCARRALHLDWRCVPACRVLADLAEQARSPRALYWRERVVALEPHRNSNLLALARTALWLGDLTNAGAALSNVAQPDPQTNPLYHELSAQAAFLQRDLDTAQRHLVEAARLAPTNAAYACNLEIVRLHLADRAIVQRAREKLETLSTDPVLGASILRALILEALSRQDAVRARALSEELQLRPGVTFDDRLLHLTLLRPAGPDPAPTTGAPSTVDGRRPQPASAAGRVFEAFLAQVEAEAGQSAASTVRLLACLAAHGQASAALAWLEHLPDEIRRDAAVRRAETDCYIAAGRWSELAAALDRSHWGRDEHLRHAVLALAYRQRGEEELARIEWKRAVRAGLASSTAALVRLAGAWQWETEAEDLLWEMARNGPDPRWAAALLRQSCALSGDTRSLWRLSKLELARDPDDLVAKNNLAATGLLLRTNLAAAHALAGEVHSAQPANAAFACTWAYSLHLRGETKKALDLLAGLPEESLRQPATAAYYGLLLSAGGWTDAARTYFALAGKGLLLPEERAWVKANTPGAQP